MKKTLILLFCASLLPATVPAQIEVSCRAANGRVLLYEPIVVTVEIINHTMKPLRLLGSNANARLTFDVEQNPGDLIPFSGEPLIPGKVVIPPDKVFTHTIDLLTRYQIRNTGPYTVTARVEWKDKVFISAKVYIDVLPGLAIGQPLVTGLSDDSGATRTYSLMTLNRDRGERLFLSIKDDQGGKCYGVFDLGPVLRLYEPVMRVDGDGNIHVVHQCSAEQYVHNAMTPKGVVMRREYWPVDGGRIPSASTSPSEWSPSGAFKPGPEVQSPPVGSFPSGQKKK